MSLVQALVLVLDLMLARGLQLALSPPSLSLAQSLWLALVSVRPWLALVSVRPWLALVSVRPWLV